MLERKTLEQGLQLGEDTLKEDNGEGEVEEGEVEGVGERRMVVE